MIENYIIDKAEFWIGVVAGMLLMYLVFWFKFRQAEKQGKTVVWGNYMED